MRTKVSCARSAASAPLPSLRRSQPCSQPWWAVYREAASRCWGVEADGMAGPDSLGGDRKSVVEGKSVDLGGGRIIKKKKHQKLEQYHYVLERHECIVHAHNGTTATNLRLVA